MQAFMTYVSLYPCTKTLNYMVTKPLGAISSKSSGDLLGKQ